ncbi:hypothetical protein D3C78_1481870 [compost metagenome]
MVRTVSMASPMLAIGMPEMITALSCWNWLSWRGRARSWTLTRVDSEISWPLSLFT